MRHSTSRLSVLALAPLLLAVAQGCAQFEQESYVLTGVTQDELWESTMHVLKEDLEIKNVEGDRTKGVIQTGWIRPYFPPDLALEDQSLGAYVVVSMGPYEGGTWFWVEVTEDFKISTGSDTWRHQRRPGALNELVNPGYGIGQRQNTDLEAEITRKIVTRIIEKRGGKPLPPSPPGCIPLPEME